MNEKQNETMQLDELAEQAGGYFAMPSADDLAYTELLFDICKQHRYLHRIIAVRDRLLPQSFSFRSKDHSELIKLRKPRITDLARIIPQSHRYTRKSQRMKRLRGIFF